MTSPLRMVLDISNSSVLIRVDRTCSSVQHIFPDQLRCRIGVGDTEINDRGKKSKGQI